MGKSGGIGIFLGPKKGGSKNILVIERGDHIFLGQKRLDYSYGSLRIPNFGALRAHINCTLIIALTVYEMKIFVRYAQIFRF